MMFATYTILCLLSGGELILPLSPVVSDGVDDHREQKEKVAPHDSPGVIVELKEGLVGLSAAGLNHLILTCNLDDLIDCEDADAEDSRSYD